MKWKNIKRAISDFIAKIKRIFKNIYSIIVSMIKTVWQKLGEYKGKLFAEFLSNEDISKQEKAQKVLYMATGDKRYAKEYFVKDLDFIEVKDIVEENL